MCSSDLFPSHDTCEEVINNASKEGYIYSKNNISNLTVLELERYFETDGVNYKIKSQLKENISFEKHNILDNNSKCPCESIYGGFQIIICSNVLIYYNAHVQARVLKMFRSCISTDGYKSVPSHSFYSSILFQYYISQYIDQPDN